ncbi:hypothetical protein [Pseudoxanthomonas sp. Root630]|uniref:hypothetical protein n=1 Tax=Pseudoxanthomonas sp. Root630 TaxID=1736574 RepID=UPI0007039AFC|nr:hypothetical protein [Pseudoxanthomonas sp. Root630]KRA45035.1 hypothetical protein ASD72_07140 [Pseudoxanthomonas sp. Root630]
MKRFVIVWASLALMPVTASAVCAIEPLEPELEAAETVYVGTVVRSTLVSSLDQLRSTTTPHERRAEIRHTVESEIVFKGDPSTVGAVLSRGKYNDPKAGRRVTFPELTALMPGDTILVVADASGPARYGLCTASRLWDRDTEAQVRAFFRGSPDAPESPAPSPGRK